MKVVFCLSVLVSVAFCASTGQDGQWYCGILGNEDCLQHSVEERCGTNGVTYRNMCDLGKAHCNDTSINQLNLGKCSVNTGTTRDPSTVVHGSQVIYDFECIMLSLRNCVPNVNEKVCGTDARTYENFCEYEKAKCTHRDLHVASIGDCNA